MFHASAADVSEVVYSQEKGFEFSMGEKELFGNFHGMMPGDERSSGAIIKNAGTEPAVFYLRIEPDNVIKETEGYLSVKVSILKDGNETVYGNVAGKTGKNINLGLFNSGDEAEIKAEIKLDKRAGNEFSNLSGLVKWVFTAEEKGGTKTVEHESYENATETDKTQSDFSPADTETYIPDTGSGEAAVMTAAFVLAILCQGIVAFLVFRKRKEETEK